MTGRQPKSATARARAIAARLAAAGALAVTGFMAAAQASIDSTATATGMFGGAATASASTAVSVAVAPEVVALGITVSAAAPSVTGGADNTITDAGDTIAYRYVITNTGNVSMASAAPVDGGPVFAGAPGTGGLGSFMLASGSLPLMPGASLTYTAAYTLSALDVYRAAGVADAVASSATASGKSVGGKDITSAAAMVKATIPAGPLLSMTETGILDDSKGTVAKKAELGETITYTYTVVNTGNVPLSDVTIKATHEGAPLPAGTITGETLTADGPLAPTVTSSDKTARDGVWSVLQPGATVTFTYVHEVTQAEVDAQ